MTDMEPKRRLTVEAIGLVMLGVLIGLVLGFVYLLARGSDDPDTTNAALETLATLGAVLAGAISGWMGRSLMERNQEG